MSGPDFGERIALGITTTITLGTVWLTRNLEAAHSFGAVLIVFGASLFVTLFTLDLIRNHRSPAPAAPASPPVCEPALTWVPEEDPCYAFHEIKRWDTANRAP